MRREEAIVVSEWIKDLGLPRGAVCLNIGSSTREFRSRAQPHIEAFMVRPLEEYGLRIVHCDMKAEDGVDEVGDLLDPAFRERLRQYEPDLVICSNLLEHLADPVIFTEACRELVKPGGFALFTVPLSYPYHPDPIDTMLRLTPTELAAMFSGWEIIMADQISTGSYWTELRGSRDGARRLAKHFARLLVPFYRPQKWWPLAHRITWLFRPYRQSLVLLRKPATDGASSRLAVEAPEGGVNSM